MAYLDNIKKFGRTAILVATATLIFNTLVFIDVMLYMIGRAIPAMMLLVIGFLAYSGKADKKAKVIYNYLTFYGIGLFVSGIILLVHYEMAAWEYYIVAPLGLVLTALGLSVKDGQEISRLWWNVLVILFMVLVLFAVHEIIITFMNDQMGSLTKIGRMGREAFLIVNAFLLYFTLSGDVQKKFELPFRRA